MLKGGFDVCFPFLSQPAAGWCQLHLDNQFEGNNRTVRSTWFSPELAVVLHRDSQLLPLALAHFVPLLWTEMNKDKRANALFTATCFSTDAFLSNFPWVLSIGRIIVFWSNSISYWFWLLLKNPVFLLCCCLEKFRTFFCLYNLFHQYKKHW